MTRQQIIIAINVLLVVAGIVAFCMFVVPDYLRRMNQEKLRNGDGKAARAKIVDMKETPTRYQGTPVITFTLAIEPADGPRISVTTDQEISIMTVGQYAPGRNVDVRYNPDKPHQVVILGISPMN